MPSRELLANKRVMKARRIGFQAERRNWLMEKTAPMGDYENGACNLLCNGGLQGEGLETMTR